MNNIIIVGGGISGLVSAIFNSRSGRKVTLIENSSDIGGLLKSYTCSRGYSFDYGTHFLRQTGIDELDEQIFNNLSKDEWSFLPYLKIGNYFRNNLNNDSPFILSTLIDKNDYKEGVKDFFACKYNKDEFNDLRSQLIGIYGEAFFKKIHKPLIKKFYNIKPEKLSPNSHHIIGLNRILISDPEKTIELKKEKFNDERLGFHSYKDGVSNLKSIYPKNGGIGRWLNHLKGILEENGVDIQLNCSVKEIQCKDGFITKVINSNGQAINADKVVWTIPIHLFLEAANLEYSKDKVSFVGLNIYHCLSDRPPLTDVYYITCNDSTFVTYRVTLHSNCQITQKGKFYPFTVEVISHENNQSDMEQRKMIFELIKMQIFDTKSKIQVVNVKKLNNGFPIPTIERNRSLNKNIERASSSVSNVSFIGKASGKAFFMENVLIEAYKDAIQNIGRK